MVAIVDYGVGNLFSLKSSFSAIGIEAKVTNDIKVLEDSSSIILPGVGAFQDAAAKLRESGMAEAVLKITAKGKPMMGICLGMQMLFEKSFEYGEHEGLGIIKGNIRPISDVIPKDYKIPHIGWNSLDIIKDSPILKYTKAGEYVYFVHSFYAADCLANTIATANYGADLTAVVQKDNVFGCQFHPEKSGNVGLGILKAFSEVRS